jgi:hypothetical protein
MTQPKYNFGIELPEGSVRIDEWRKAQSVPGSELPQLNDEEKETARKLGINEDALARTVLAGQYGQERMHARAQKFGDCVGEILEEMGSGTVDAVIFDPFRGRWLVRLRTPESLVITVPGDLVEDLLDSGKRPYLEQLKHLIKEQLAAAGEKTAQ